MANIEAKTDLLIEDKMFRELVEAVLSYNPSLNVERMSDAYNVARSAHGDQMRRDGSPYITHPIAAAEITAEMGLDEDSVVAAILHDVIEDSNLTYNDIAKRFGTGVADIVEGVTKLTRVQYTSKEDEQMENLRKMLIAMAKDIRVILIKIADRLHNMRTMAYQTEEKQLRKSLETMEIYAPIAHRLGMQRIKWELEDLSLLYLDPIGYNEIVTSLERKQTRTDEFLTSVEEKIKARLDEDGIDAMIHSRVKHIYSIYRKMYAQKSGIDEIFDLYAFRVIVDDISDCYNVLGLIHDTFKPIPGRFKDYISTPKPNMYQSVHTTVIGTEGLPFEVQIRTREMHNTAEYGIAAHWKYKSGDAGLRMGDEEKFAWVRHLLESQQDADAQDFFHDLKIDMFADDVFVFTPRGDVINMPAGATPIDFAYSIHSAIGNSMIGAKVNGRIVTFGTVLQNGDIVEVLTSKSAPGPSRDWMNIAKSGSSRTKIKQWFKKERREENIANGREMFEAELKRNNLNMANLNDDDVKKQILKKIAVNSIDDMFAAIGYGGMTATRAVNRIKDELLRISKHTVPKTALDKLNEQVEKHQKQTEMHDVFGVLVEGQPGCLIKFSRCCTPVPGDDIVGFITRGYGVSVHRTDCANYISGQKDSVDGGRWIGVNWVERPNEHYMTTLKIEAQERGGLLMDLATVLNAMSARVKSLSTRDAGSNKSTATVTLEVANLEELKSIVARIGSISGVQRVTRAGN